MTPASSTTPQTFTATFTILPAAPGTPSEVVQTEPSDTLARTFGLVHAMQDASWKAFVYGSATITHVESGRVWTMTVTQTEGK